MRILLAKTLSSLAGWLRPKSGAWRLAAGPWTTVSSVDAFGRNRNPTPSELLAELKQTAWTCASLNSATCASFPPRLYVATDNGQARPKCLTKVIGVAVENRLRHKAQLPGCWAKAERIEEVVEHPLLTLLQQVNPVHNAFDLWELTTLYQEVHGVAYWHLTLGPLGIPEEIWILPSQNVTPKREPGSRNIVDYYLYQSGATSQRFDPAEIICFRYPDPGNPYLAGMSPLRACWEQVALASDYAAMKKSIYENRAIPAVVVSPAEIFGEEDRDRLEAAWNQTFRRGGNGSLLITEKGARVQVLSQSMGDVAALADMKATKEDIANAFHVPLAFLTSETNLANLRAAEHQHMAKAITPRLRRRDEKINEQLIPLYDPSGRLFVASEDPVPLNRTMDQQQQEIDMKFGVVTINEIRQERGLAPVPWGNRPWLPAGWEQRGS